MNLRQITLVPPGAPSITLGSVTYTGGAPVGYTLEDLRLDPADRTLSVVPLPLVAGGLVAPGRLSFRVIEAEGMIVGANAAAVRTLRRTLVAALADRDASPVTVRWDPGVGVVETYGFLDGAVEVTATGSHFVRYSFRLVCPDPVAYSTTVATTPLAAFPGTVVQNSGSAEVWPELTISTSGTVTSLRVGNSSTQRYLQLDNLTGTGAITVVTAPGYETVVRGGVPLLQTVNIASKFFGLAPGANALYVTVLSGGGSASGSAVWRAGWVD
jgi:hypothetical protein